VYRQFWAAYRARQALVLSNLRRRGMATEIAQAPVAPTLESTHAPPTELLPPQASAPAVSPAEDVPHAARAWEFFRSMGSPKFHVAPMVDQVSI
jgi:hypothetical protein